MSEALDRFRFLLKTDYLNGLTIGASITNFVRDMQMSGINSIMV